MNDIKQKLEEASGTADQFVDNTKVIPLNSAILLFDLAIKEDRKNLLKIIQEQMRETVFWKVCEDYFTPEQRDFFINLITNTNK